MKENKGLLLEDFLKRDRNNLDLFRIIASCLVIVGHSYVLFPKGNQEDVFRLWTTFTYSGALAVKLFFFISGLVVTNSLLQKKDIVDFAISRTFRIFPALLLVLVATSLIIAPFLSSFSPAQYFDTPSVYVYIKQNIVLNTNYNLPKVFEKNTYANAVNGSLWTLPYEVGCYLFLCAMFLLSIITHKKIGSIICIAIIIDTLLPQKLFLNWLWDNNEIIYLPASFFAGVLLALNKDKYYISFRHFIGFALLTYLLWHTKYAEILFCFSMFSLTLYVSSLQWFMKLKPKYDFSYGIYLWGFFVQQNAEYFMPGSNIYLKMILSLIISIVFGALSWFIIEERSIRLGKNLIKKINNRRGTNSAALDFNENK